MTLPKSVKTVGEGAFFGCKVLEVYDTIDPDILSVYEKKRTGSNSSISRMASQYTDRGYWNDHKIVLRSAETGQIKYEVSMVANDDADYRYELEKGWGKHGEFSFKDLDELFPEMKKKEYKITLALNRLRWPVDLTEEAKAVYVAYLCRFAKDVVKTCIDGDNMEAFLICAPLGVLKKNNMDELMEYALKAQAVEFSAYLMNYKAEHFPSKSSNSFSLSMKTAPLFAPPKTGTRKIGRYKGSDTVVEFPTEWKGEPITGIANTTYNKIPDNYKAITAVIIPEGYTYIGDNAFAGCENLESVTLPATLESIGRYAFGNCPKLKEIILPDSVTALGKECFMRCTALETVQFSKKLTAIPERTFYGCASLKEIDLPENIRFAGKDSFVDTPALQKFVIRSKRFDGEGQIFYNTPPVYCYPNAKIAVYGIRKKDLHYMSEDGNTASAPEPVIYTDVEELVFQDQIFVLSGFGEVEETQISKIITEKGGIIKSSVVVKTNYLILNENYSGVTAKYKKALELNGKGKTIAVLSAAKFHELAK